MQNKPVGLASVNHRLSRWGLAMLLVAAAGCSPSSSGDGTPKGGGTGTLPSSYALGGQVSGLANGLTVSVRNATETVTAGNGSFEFPTKLANGSDYVVTLSSIPSGYSCDLANESGRISGADVLNVAVVCVADVVETYSIGGSLSGLSGAGVVRLTNNGGDSLSLSTNGKFTFATELAKGHPYNVLVAEHPTGQTCSVTGGSGIVGSADVASVRVACVTDVIPSYSIGGKINGLTGTGLKLQNNGGDTLNISPGATSFTFATKLLSGATYNVTVSTQPAGQTCSVTTDSGTVVSSNVTSVRVTCSDLPRYSIGGSISGLTGTGLKLQNNGGDTLNISPGATSFTFATKLLSGATYNVSVSAQPAGQTCSVTTGSGMVASSNVTSVRVTCSSPTTYSIGGSISGLSASGLKLKNNGGDELSVSSGATSFTFLTKLLSGTTYNVSVSAQPAGLSCSVSGAAGTVASSNVVSVVVNCSPVGSGLSVAPSLKALVFSWPSVAGATSYKLYENIDGASGFSLIASPSSGATSYTHAIGVHLLDWSAAQYMLESCVGSACTNRGTIGVADAMLKTIGYLKADAGKQGSSFGQAVALSADGKRIAITQSSASLVRRVFVYSLNAGVWGLEATINRYPGSKKSEIADTFGNNLALSADGSTLAVGEHFDGCKQLGIVKAPAAISCEPLVKNQGAVTVYVRSPSGAWSAQAYIKSDTHEVAGYDARQSFGYAVALNADGNVLVVGAPESDEPLNGDVGAVHVFTRAGGEWTRQARFDPTTNTAWDSFGAAVAVSADGLTLAATSVHSIVGLGGSGKSDSNRAYVFKRVGETWVQKAKLATTDPDISRGQYGKFISLSADGSSLAVGAPGEGSLGQGVNPPEPPGMPGGESLPYNLTGAVYVYAESGAGTWDLEAFIKASNAEKKDQFGSSVSFSADGNLLAVGAIGERSAALGVGGNQADNSGRLYEGAAYLYRRQAGVWQTDAYIKHKHTNSHSAGGELGHALALSADGRTLAISARLDAGTATGFNGNGELIGGTENRGAVLLY